MLNLTFDDGPSEWTPAILDLLFEHDRHATFFVVGESIGGHGHLLRRMLAEGHRIGNHTFTHTRLTELSYAEQHAELVACDAVIRLVCGERPLIWRAPYFARNDETDRAAANIGLTHVGADIIPDDWRFDDAEQIAERVMRHASPRAVVCLHDGLPPDGGNGTDSRQPTVDALRMILEADHEV